MADIYVVYSSQDRALVQKLVAVLETRWEVWWDQKLVGRFPQVIEREIANAKCVLPVWSATSRESDMVRDELELAKSHGIQILPVSFDGSRAPYGFSAYSSVELRGWSGDFADTRFQRLIERLTSVVAPREPPKRPDFILGNRIMLPSIFLSASSHETRLTPLEAIKACRLFRTKLFLISAYDLTSRRRERGIIGEIKRFRAEGGVVLIDSGNYEASRIDDSVWAPDDLKDVLSSVPHDLAFCFDVMNPSRVHAKAVRQITEAVERDRKFTKAPIIPIVHAAQMENGSRNLEALPDLICAVAHNLRPPLIAVPERELGPGVIARARTVRRIRVALDDLPFYQPLHLLGTCDPWSIAVFAAAGADSFDGLEWCRMAVDRESGRLNHLQHFDFFTFQAALAEASITVEALNDEKVDFAGKVAFHNLDYYSELSRNLQRAATKGDFEAFVIGLIGRSNTDQLRKQIPELFS